MAINQKKSLSREDAIRFRKIREQMPSRTQVMEILKENQESAKKQKDRKSAKPREMEP